MPRKLSSAGLAFSELLIEVFRINALALAAGDRLSKPSGLSSARWQVMGVVDHGPVPVAHVARTMGLARQSVRETADALIRDGYLRYEDNPHHRTARLLMLTDAGRRALREVELRHATWASQLGRKLEEAPLRAALALLTQTREQLERDIARPSASERERARKEEP